MRAVVQRVKEADVSVDNNITGAIKKGLMVLLGVEDGDTEADALYMADKITGLRIFEDEEGKIRELRVAEGDMGKVSGRQGRIAKEIRTIVKTVAQRSGEKVTVEIVD